MRLRIDRVLRPNRILSPGHLQTRMAVPTRVRRGLHGVVVAVLAMLPLASTTSVAAAGDPEGNVDLPRFPSISPDGSTVVFSWRGDLWSVPFEGGRAIRLTSHPGREHDSQWTADGSSIVFESDRDGVVNLYSMNPDGTNIRQLTHLDTGAGLSDVGVDGQGHPVVGFSAYLEGDLYRAPRPYEIDLAGGEPRRVHDAFGSDAVRSPDGTRVAFVRGGVKPERRHYRGADRRDVWVHDSTLDTFRKVAGWEGNDMTPRWAGNDAVLFLSDRANNTHNIHRVSVDGGEAEALTDFDEIDVAEFDTTPDGQRIVLHRWDTLYGLDLSEADPVPKPIRILAPEDGLDETEILDISRRVSEAAMNPDGKSIAVIAYGEVLVRATEDDAPTRRITESHGREGDLVWSPDGTTLYFSAIDGGNASIFAATVERTRDELRTAYEDATKAPEPEEEPEDEPEVLQAEITDVPTDDDAAAAGDDAAADTDGEGDAGEKDEKDGEEDEEAKKEEKDEDKDPTLDPARWSDAVRFTITPVVHADTHDHRPLPSPDGMSLAFVRGVGDLMILDLATGEERLLRAGWDRGIEFRWSDDSHWIVFDQADINFNQDVFIVPADGSAAPINITRHPDNDGGAHFSADARILAFTSERDDEEFDVYHVFLDRKLEKLAGPELDDYFEAQAKEAKARKPLDPHEVRKALERRRAIAAGEEVEDKDDEEKAYEAPFTTDDLETAYRRVRQVTNLPGNSNRIELVPAGDTILFNYSTGAPDASGLHSIGWDGSERKKLGGTVSMMGLTLDGTKLVAVDGGQAETIAVSGGKTDRLPVSQRIRVDLETQSSEKFLEAAAIMGSTFYHPTMKGLDWAALTERYHDLARKTRTADEFNWVGNRLLGELSASHMGIRAPSEPMDARESIGRLGVGVESVADGWKVVSIIPDGPAEDSDTPLAIGDEIIAIEFERFDRENDPTDTISNRLRDRIGDETVVTVRRADADGEVQELDLLLEPISRGAEMMLVYRDTQLRRAALVDEWSKGRIGYAHIRGMSQPSLDEFERDLFAAADGRDGLIIDVRDNGGGWTTDRLLSSIMVTPHAYTVPRGADPNVTTGYPQDRLFIQRYTMPIDMLCNEKSYSNAEIISHAFKTLGRGTLVGQETHGSVISTGGTSLLDGTTLRLPFRGWYLPDGTDMENHGARPDIVVEQTPEDEAAGADAQLKAAVEDLLRRLDGGA
jgi:tricorn protease